MNLDKFAEDIKALVDEVKRHRADRGRWVILLQDELGSLLRDDAGVPAVKLRPGPYVPGHKPNQIIRRDGRPFTRTAAVVKSRKIQGQYLGYLRQVPKKDRGPFQKIARGKSVAEAVAALRKHLGR